MDWFKIHGLAWVEYREGFVGKMWLVNYNNNHTSNFDMENGLFAHFWFITITITRVHWNPWGIFSYLLHGLVGNTETGTPWRFPGYPFIAGWMVYFMEWFGDKKNPFQEPWVQWLMIMVNDDGCYMVNDDGYYVVNDISIIFYVLSMGDLQDPNWWRYVNVPYVWPDFMGFPEI